MKIELKNIKIREVFEGYKNVKFDSKINKPDVGVVGYGGKLNIRPAYQREFIYDSERQKAVINSVKKGFPLNTIYWVDNENDTYEVLDGQQRLISICEFLSSKFTDDDEKYFHSLTKKEQDKIFDYELFVYFVSGDEREKLDWFEIINISGVKLEEQELKNAIYTGPWLSEAKRFFSVQSQAGDYYSSKYQNKVANRQLLLELALSWICMEKNKKISEYMSEHQHDKNADELIAYFKEVIEWVKKNFVDTDPDMKKINWGQLYYKYKNKPLNYQEVSNEVKRLRQDSDVENKSGIYEYILSGDEKHLNIRAFTKNDKISVYEQQNRKCNICKEYFEFNEMEGDHITPWSKGGKTELKNLQMLCMDCNRKKSNK
ncbi:MAG: HNH endonuclease family protein [Mycoplasmoidaceae bacterium]